MLGDELTPAAGGTIVARFNSATGPGALAVTRAQRVIVHGFSAMEAHTTNNDGDAVVDIVELYQNELRFIAAH